MAPKNPPRNGSTHQAEEASASRRDIRLVAAGEGQAAQAGRTKRIHATSKILPLPIGPRALPGFQPSVLSLGSAPLRLIHGFGGPETA